MRHHAGLVGNGRTAALIEPNLALSWFCLPRFDGQPLFAGALDPERGGALTIELLVDGQPVALTPVSQRYLGHSAVLVTELAGGDWRLTAHDYMPWGGSGLVRRFYVAGGAGVSLRWTATPVASAQLPVGGDGATFTTPDGVALIALDDLADGVGALYLAYGETLAEAEAALAALRAATVEAELAGWQAWLAPARRPTGVKEAWAEAYWRGLITIRLLSYEPTGALLAAPTASFPAIPGGDHQWDYRYIWLRDGYYTAMALDAAGLHKESRAFYDFCFTLQEANGHWSQPLYTVTGENPHEIIVEDLAGPGGEVPVRLGNAASDQLQLDNEGNVLHGLWFHYKTSGDLGALQAHWPGVKRAADWTVANWNQIEAGIWEVREYQGHWVHGKAMCYAALTSAARIAAALGFNAEATRWQAEAEEVARVVLAQGFDPSRQAFVRHWDAQPPTPAPIDISVLALVFYGLVPAADRRVVTTVERMYRPADDGGLQLFGGLCRWESAAVPFYLPTLWLARYHLMAGETELCDRWLDRCLDSATSLGLMAEHFDGRDGSQWGNYPQAFSHEEVVRLVLERGQGWSFFDWEFKV